MNNPEVENSNPFHAAPRLAEIEVNLSRAFSDRNLERIRELHEALDRADLATLRSGASLWSLVERAMQAGALAEAAAIFSASISFLTNASSVSLLHRFWDPHFELMNFIEKLPSALPLVQEKAFGQGISILVRHFYENPAVYDGDNFEELAAYGADTVVALSRVVDLLRSAPQVQQSIEENLKFSILPIAQRTYRKLEAAYAAEVEASSLFSSWDVYSPLLTAVAALAQAENRPQMLLEFAELELRRFERNPQFKALALLALHKSFSHFGEAAVGGEDSIRYQGVVERVYSCLIQPRSDEDQAYVSPDALAVVPLLQRSKLMLKAAIEIGQAILRRHLLEYASMEDSADALLDDGIDDVLAEELLDSADDDRSLGRELSTVPLEDHALYAVAPVLRCIATGCIDSRIQEDVFHGQAHLLSGLDRNFAGDPHAAILLAFSGLSGMLLEQDDFSVTDLQDVLQEPGLRIALRPTREDVSEPFCFSDALLGAIEALTRSTVARDRQLCGVLADAVDRGTLVVSKNIWWDSSTGQKAYEMGLPREDRVKVAAKARAELSNYIQVAEEVDGERTKRLLKALRGLSPGISPVDLGAVRTVDSSSEGGTPRLRTASPTELKSAHDLLSPIVWSGQLEGELFLPCGVGIGLRGERSRQVGIVVMLESGDDALCERLKRALEKLVPVPVFVEVTGRFELL